MKNSINYEIEDDEKTEYFNKKEDLMKRFAELTDMPECETYQIVVNGRLCNLWWQAKTT